MTSRSYAIQRIDAISTVSRSPTSSSCDNGFKHVVPGFYVIPDAELLALAATDKPLMIKIEHTESCYDNKLSFAKLQENAGGFRPNFHHDTGLVVIVPDNINWQGYTPLLGMVSVLMDRTSTDIANSASFVEGNAAHVNYAIAFALVLIIIVIVITSD